MTIFQNLFLVFLLKWLPIISTRFYPFSININPRLFFKTRGREILGDVRMIDWQKIGSEWTVHLEQLAVLKKWAKDPTFQRSVAKVKQENKLRLAELLESEYHVKVNPASIFDIQVRFFQWNMKWELREVSE